jgi:hypothetical protein
LALWPLGRLVLLLLSVLGDLSVTVGYLRYREPRTGFVPCPGLTQDDVLVACSQHWLMGRHRATAGRPADYFNRTPRSIRAT